MRFRFFLLLLGLYAIQAQCQAPVRDYWIEFQDKNFSPYSVSRPEEFLSARSIARRLKQHIGITNQDLPVSPYYVKQVQAAGAKIILTSRWLNAVTIQTSDSVVLDKVSNLTCVKNVSRVYRMGKHSVEGQQSKMLQVEDGYAQKDYGTSFNQIDIHNGEDLHQHGYRGKGMQIAIIDAGFYHVDTLTAFAELRDRKGILGTHDFVNPTQNMFQGDTHGMYVLSAITGFLPGKLIGAAPEADFYLLRSENDNSEMPVEEDAWVAAAEWADSAGVDVISSSLGYSTFDDDSLDHSYIDMDGHTTHISKAASLLASKGIILVSSAGNSGNKPWHYVTAPADAENILTVGAVDRNRELVGFSSRGPTYDGRVKPDVMSMGYATVVANVADNETDLVSGTSLATPIISGLVTCLWQEFPQKTSFQVMDAIRRSSSLYSMPNDSFGYGIPDFSFAEKLLSMDNIPSSDVVTEVYPNPFIDYFTLDFYSSQEQQIEVTFMDAMGRVISVNTISAGANSLTKINMGHERLAHGIYFAIIKSNNGTTVKKVIRG